uniref:Sjoegren syndrome/scleroderma autoantigen 1 n=1 Tax=Spongospora subterranea TaxID=70186 RepID=A0A0H5R6B6_9EUKA|eukprot:CRZ09700.1 hypothetical protein [Spongospora subterranea]
MIMVSDVPGERSESTNDDLVNRISERLVQGWTMLARHCPVCTTVLVGHRSHGIFCVGCQLPCVTEEDASAMQLEVAPSQIPQETVTDDDDDWQPPSAEEQRIMDERRAHRDRVSDLMASKLLAGWAMLNEHCETCATPLLRDPSQRLFCVACDAYSDEIRASPSAVGEGNASAVEPALHTRPPVTATSSLIEADDAASSQQHFELVDGKPLLFELGAQMKANLDQGWSIGSNAPKCNLCSLPFFVDPLQRLCCVFCNYYSPNTKADQETTQLPLSMSASTLSLTTSLNNSKVALLTKLDLLTVELTAAADSCSISRLANTIDVVARAIKSVSECSV